MMTNERRMLVALMKEAASTMWDMSCNDFDLSTWLTQEEQVSFVTAYHLRNGDPEEINNSIHQLPNFSNGSVMYLLACFVEEM